jgi:hypothetical protein
MFAPPVAKVQGKAPASSIPQSAYSPPMFRPTRHHDCDPPGMRPGEPASRASWDFSVIPTFSPDRASQTEPPAPRRAPPLPAALQTKLAIGAVDDPLEHEADRVADQVMRMPALEVASTATPPQISRKCEMCEQEEKVQRKEMGTAAPGLTEAPTNVHEVLRSPGQPLDEATRAYFEPRFGHDFSQISIHSDSHAAASARSVNALAYSVGSHIAFGSGQYSPATPDGQRLIAHELTHVVQRSAAGSNSDGVVMRQPESPKSPLPLAEPEQGPKVVPLDLTAAERGSLGDAARSRIDQAFAAFLLACKDHVASIKAEEKMKAEVLAALTDIFFGLSAPVIASAILGRGGTAITKKLTSVLSTANATKLSKQISESDFLKEGVKGIGKIATTEIKLNPSALFGESDVDAFANQLTVQFHAGVQAITDAIAFHKLTDDQLISTFLAYDVEYTNLIAYRETLKTLFQHFRSFVHPIGTETAPTEVSSVDTDTRAVWVVLWGGSKRLYLERRTVHLTPFVGADESVDRTEVPKDIEPFVIAKTQQEFGKVETVVSLPELMRIAAEKEAERSKPIVTPINQPTVTPIGPEEEAEVRGNSIAEKMRQYGVTEDARREIRYYLNYFEGKAREIFIAKIGLSTFTTPH